MIVKLDAKLPKDHRANGLAVLSGWDVAHDPTDVIAVVRLSPKSLEQLFDTDDDAEVLKLAVAEVEVLEGEHEKQAMELLDDARSARTGQPRLEGETEGTTP